MNGMNQLTKFRDFTSNSLKKDLIAYITPLNSLQRPLGVDLDITHFVADLYSMKGIRLPNFKTFSELGSGEHWQEEGLPRKGFLRRPRPTLGRRATEEERKMK
ncbi:hypothetical protein TNCV_2235691 [Trichonephila clavipes]|nr:hypothetical protein TNCV_2235691 [Trichonephila clavipes]